MLRVAKNDYGEEERERSDEHTSIQQIPGYTKEAKKGKVGLECYKEKRFSGEQEESDNYEAVSMCVAEST